MKKVNGWKFRRTTLITLGMLAFLVGLALARTGVVFSASVSGIAALLGVIFLPRLRLVAEGVAVLLGTTLGIWRGSEVLKKLKPYDEINQHKVVVLVHASTDGFYNDKSQLEFNADHAEIIRPGHQNLLRALKISGYGENAVYRGDVVQVEGKLYKTRGSRQASIGYADMHTISHGHSVIDDIRRRFTAGMESALPEPLASFALGLLFGQRSTLPTEVTTQLSAVGLTHIIAVFCGAAPDRNMLQ